MSAPRSVTANFGTVRHEITSVPAGRTLTVDNASCTAPCPRYWMPGSSHTIATTSPQNGATDTRYVFASWSDAGAISHSVTAASSATTYTANFTTQYKLTTSATAGGTISPATNWHNSGAVVSVSATANSGYTFTGFSGGALFGTTTPQNLTMSAPKSVTANFTAVAQYTLTTSVSPAGAGTISLTPPGGVYPSGTQVTVVATPNAGYQVTGLTGVDSSYGAAGTVAMNANRSVIAYFTPGSLSVTPSLVTLSSAQQQIFTATGTGGASVTWSMSPAVGTLTPNSANVLYTAPVSITPTPVYISATTVSGSAPATANLTTGSPGPVISNIQVPSQYLTTTAATIRWTTSTNANSQIYWGTTASYTSATTLDTALTLNHEQYISGLSPSTTYHYQVRSTDQSGNLASSPDQVFTTPSSPPPVPSEFTTCVGGTSAVCRLNPGTYVVNSTIEINRSNITVQGGGSSTSDTKLVRHSTYTGDLIRIGPTASVTGVALKYLTVCGGSDITPNWGTAPISPVGCPRGPTDCGVRTRYATDNPDAAGLPDQCVDVRIARSALPQPPANPFSSPPASYAVEFDHVDLEDATGHALDIRGYHGATPAQSIRADDICFHDGAINYSGVTGIRLGVDAIEGIEYGRKVCDGYGDPVLGFANDTGVYAPRNIRVEHSTFTENRTGVMGGIGRWIAFRNNTFARNYIWPQAQGGAVPGTNPPVGDPNQSVGGTLEFDACADQIEIKNNNAFTGPGSDHARTQALELYGRNITVDSNTISGYVNEAIVANSVRAAAIQNNTISFAAASNPPDGGITVTTVGAAGPCTEKPLNLYRESRIISISGNGISGQEFGVNLAEHPWRSTGAIHNLTIGTNSGNWGTAQYWKNPFVWTNGYTGEEPTLAPQLPFLGVTPRVLPVDVESASARALCPKLGTGTARASFTFAASDDSNGSGNLPGYEPRIDYGAPGYAGARQIEYLEGLFRNTAPPIWPEGTVGECHFFYASEANSVYLDDGTGTWGGGTLFSPVGPGGHDLAHPNSGGIIHAATSSALNAEDIQPGRYARSVTLDVTFVGSGRKHLYVYTRNKQGIPSYAPADGLSQLIWQYWGWWEKP